LIFKYNYNLYFFINGRENQRIHYLFNDIVNSILYINILLKVMISIYFITVNIGKYLLWLSIQGSDFITLYLIPILTNKESYYKSILFGKKIRLGT